MMRLKCPRCLQGYRIPDERIPVGKEIVFPCPNCKKGLLKGTKLPSFSKEMSGQLPKRQPKTFAPSSSSSKKSPQTFKDFSGDELRIRILRTVRDLPAMPQIMIKAQRIMADPSSSLKDLATLVKNDQAIVTKALQMANSAFYGLSSRVSSIEHATVLLGSKAFAELVTLSAASKLLDAKLKGYQAESGVLWRHSLAVAFGAKIIASKRYPKLANDAFTAGIIHDAGKLILDQAVYDKRAEFDDFFKDGQQTFLDAEKRILGFNHAEIAADICRKWRIPDKLANSIRLHHEPSLVRDDELANILHFADSIAMMSDFGTGTEDVLYRLEDTTREFLGLTDDEIGDIMDVVFKSVENVESGMK